jgi:hypothetical protein
MKSKERMNGKPIRQVALAWMTIGWMCCSVGNTCNAQTPPPNLSPDLQEVVKLSQAHMGDDVIVNYVRNSGKSYKLSADDLIYLNSQGVSQGVISALQAATSPSPNPAPVAPAPATPASYAPTPAATGPVPPGPAPAPAMMAPSPAAPPAGAPSVSLDYFHAQLAPFGTWVEVPGYGLCWRPDSAIRANPDWRPYYDMGQWVQTDNGLFWQSEYTWGDIPFHYGRWVLVPGRGWLWAPDLEWGPAWVFWRHAEGDAAIGWAPLPVGAVFVGGGFMYRGARVGIDFDFGLGEGVFVFVGYDHFHEGFFRMRGREWAWHIGGERFHGFYGRSVLRNEFRRDEHGRFVNEGIGHDRMARATHGRVEQAHFEERRAVGDRAALAHGAAEKPGEKAGASKVFRPPAAAAAKPAAASSSAKKK